LKSYGLNGLANLTQRQPDLITVMSALTKNIQPDLLNGELKPVIARPNLAVSLLRYAEKMMSVGMHDSAITLLCAALVDKPGQVSLIHKIGQCLKKTGEDSDADLCFRGVLPDCINQQYFNSDRLASRVMSSSECSHVEYLLAFEEERLELAPPVRNDTDKRYNQFNFQTTEARETFCTVAQNGSVWFDGYNTLALDSDGNIIREQIKGNEFASYHAATVTEPKRLNGCACFLDGRSSKIYYHWILDILPKLGVVEKSGISLQDIDYFVVSAASTFQLDTLRACGVREEQLVFEAGSAFYKADKMIVPCLRNDLGERVYYGLGVGLGSWIPRYLQEQLGSDSSALHVVQSGTVPVDTDKPVRVYISRSTRGSRNIANEPEMIDALQVRGFQTVEFERLTVVQQAELMSRAEVVVGVHGAGFTNLSFCSEGAQVIEIFGDYVVPCYWALSAVAGLNYAQFMARSVDGSAVVVDNPGEKVNQLRDMEIDIDVDAFVEYLDSVLGD